MYARVRARDAGVRVPLDKTWHLFGPLVPHPQNRVDFHIVLDPLQFGFIPKSIEGTIGAIVVAVVLGLCSVRYAINCLERLAVQADSRPAKK